MAAGGLWSYHNGLRAPFIFDDYLSIPDNPTIRSVAAALFPPHGAGVTVEGRPLLNLSFAINYALAGNWLMGYHLANVAIHLGASLLLFGIVRRAARSDPVGLVAALLWAVHPLQTESVTYLAQRAESLMGLFYLGAVYGFIRWAGVAGNRSWAVVSAVSCLLAVGVKEVAVTAPVLIAAYDRFFLCTSWREVWRRRRRYYLALGSSWVWLACLVAGAGSRGHTIGPSSGIGPIDYALSQTHAIFLYLRLAVWPAPLIIDYGPALVRGMPGIVLGVAGVAALLALAAGGLAHGRVWGFMVFAFLLLLAPTSSVVGGTRQMIAEHRMYLALAPLTILAALGFVRWGGARGVFAGCVLAGILSVVTVQRNEAYSSQRELYADAVQHRPENPYAQANYGFELMQAGRPEEAKGHFEAAVALKPDYPQAQYNLGVVYAQEGNVPGALKQYRTALKMAPEYPEAHNNLGVLLAQTGRVAEAETEFAEAVRLDPRFDEARANLAQARASLGR